MIGDKALLYCWVSQNFCVLVPKKRGVGYLKVPYGHHYDGALTDIANAAHVDVVGLDGALMFECGGAVFHGGDAARQSFAAKIVPKLESHYGLSSREISSVEYWEKHPLGALIWRDL